MKKFIFILALCLYTPAIYAHIFAFDTQEQTDIDALIAIPTFENNAENTALSIQNTAFVPNPDVRMSNFWLGAACGIVGLVAVTVNPKSIEIDQKIAAVGCVANGLVVLLFWFTLGYSFCNSSFFG
jgi:hypothetical protein